MIVHVIWDILYHSVVCLCFLIWFAGKSLIHTNSIHHTSFSGVSLYWYYVMEHMKWDNSSIWFPYIQYLFSFLRVIPLLETKQTIIRTSQLEGWGLLVSSCVGTPHWIKCLKGMDLVAPETSVKRPGEQHMRIKWVYSYITPLSDMGWWNKYL